MSEETPDFFHSSSGPTDHFAVDDLLVDFSNDDDQNDVDPVPDPEANVLAVADSCNSSSFSGGGLANFSGDISGSSDFSGGLCVPYDEWAELEWLSNFVEESFSSSDDVQRLQPIPGFKTRSDAQSESRNNSPNPNPIFTDVSVPAKARSKRSRAAAGASIWASRGLQVINPNPNLNLDPNPNPRDDSFTRESTISVPAASHPPQQKKSGGSRKKEGSSCSSRDGGGEGRRCLHCATDKTPQWRTGPMGPKTLCNACGVRYKSGRLVPEYRPAASPTFVLTKHSNSHRKVMELRRQKEMIRAQQQFLDHHHHPTANMIFDVSSDGDDYLIHQNVGPDFQQLI